MTKCIKCGAEATVRFSPDLDIEGIGACEEHKDEIKADLYIVVYTGNWKRFDKKYNNKNQKKCRSQENLLVKKTPSQA